MTTSIVPSAPQNDHKVDAIVFLVYNDRIRRAVVDGRNHYSLVDLVGIFSDTIQNPRQYWNDIKKSMIREGFQVSENVRRLRLMAPDGRMRLTDCGDIVTVRRVIMSIPSVKAEPLRMWLAGKDDALLAYREGNVARGIEWAADSIHQEMIKAGNDMTWSAADDDDQPWKQRAKRP